MPAVPPGKPSDKAAFVEGTVLASRYRIIRYIAQGAMGEVYEVEDLMLRGRLALKTIRPEIASDSNAVERFKREIHLARIVTHPSVCRIYDLGIHEAEGGGPTVMFLTMELLPGETLSARIARRGRLSSYETLPLLDQMAAGLDAAHSLGIIHRDFKSGNVMLVPSKNAPGGTRVVVTDFGLARPMASSDAHAVASISDTGVVVGTPAYMAPEQVQGLTLTPAADIYALGIVAYEMLTAKRPFDGGSAMSVAVKRLTQDPPSPRQLVADLDPRWEAAVLKCLQRDPLMRYARATDFPAAIRGETPNLATSSMLAVPSAAPMTAPSAPSRDWPADLGRWVPRRAALYTTAAVVVAALGVAYALWSRRQPAPAATAETATPKTSDGRPAAPIVPRRSVAVLGLNNASERPDAAWLGTALSEMLTTELSAGGALRLVAPTEVARAKTDLRLGEPASLDRDTLQRVRQNLGTDYVLLGSYTLVGGAGSRLLRIDPRLQDTSSGEVVASAPATGTEEQLFDVVARAGTALRQKLGVPDVSPAEAVAVEASLPRNREAARLYVDGLSRLRAFDAEGARDLLEKSVAADPKHPLPRIALAEAWTTLGYDAKARDEARQAAALADALPPEQRTVVVARFHETAKEWDKAIELYRSAFQSHPDSLEDGLRLASAQTVGGKPKEALVTLEALRKLPAPASQDPRLDIAEARALLRLGEAKRAEAVAQAAAKKASATGARLLVAQARLLESAALRSQGDSTRAMAASEEARSLFEAGGMHGSAARAVEQMALTLHRKGELDGSRRLFEKALSTHRQLGDQASVARVLNNLGNVLREQGNLQEATKQYDQALATFRQIGARNEAASTLLDVGSSLFKAGDLAGAGRRYQDALSLYSELGDKPHTAMSLTNLAEVLTARGQVDEALKLHQESLATNREIGDKSGAAYDLFRIGEVLALKGDAQVARDKLQEALSMQDSLGEKAAAAETRLVMAAALLDEGKPKEAEALARQAEEVLRTEGAADGEAHAQLVLADALLAQGKTAEAGTAAARGAEIAAKGDDRRLRLAATMTSARVRAAKGKAEDATAALATLEAARAEAVKAGFAGVELEARLAMAAIERTGGRAGYKGRLAQLARDAQAKGFGRIARLASAS